MKHLKSSILFGSGFAGGLFAGWAISCLKDPDSFPAQKEKAEQTVTRISAVIKEQTERLREINGRIKKELSDPIPDLYRATESLSLNEDELIYD